MSHSHPIVYLELHTSDPAQARSLYAELLRWRPERIHTDSGSYQALELGGGIGGGRRAPAPARPAARGAHPTSANSQPAFGHYIWDDDENAFVAEGIAVLTLDGDHISELTVFREAELFERFGLPDRL
jgi:hypothetical protein